MTAAPSAGDPNPDSFESLDSLNSTPERTPFHALPKAHQNLIQSFFHANGLAQIYTTQEANKAVDESKINETKTAKIHELCAQSCAIILCANAQNLAHFQRTKSFAKILDSALGESRGRESRREKSKSLEQDVIDSAMPLLESTSVPESTLTLITALQYAILSSITPARLHDLKSFMTHIIAAGLVDIHTAREIFVVFEQFLRDCRQASQSQATAPAKPIETKALADEFASICTTLIATDPSTKHTLESAQKKLLERGFSIGVAGVLSAGKSSFLNALLGKGVLGTSTIPETASLTILRYGDQESAVVEFFTQEEFEALGAESSTCAISQEKRDLLEKGSIEIPLNELSRYTSANHEDRFCDLVKRVTLTLPLEFLQGVEIVDTPGIDDPVIKREELTKSYMSQCDMLIYVMNASCAATQKDMEFILESLLGGHIARLLVVLTRADLLGKPELESSLNYTKESLQRELQKARYDGDVEGLIKRIDFIPVASLYALGYKLGDEKIIAQAREQGFALEHTGLPQVQAYLESMLFSENSPKQRDMLYSAYRTLLGALESSKSQLLMRKQILQASSQDREKIIQELTAKEHAFTDRANTLSQKLQSVSSEFSAYLENLLALISAHLHAHNQRLYTQLYDDITYEYAKNTKPSSQRTHAIIARGLEDSYHDILREYKYKVTKKLGDLSALLESQSDITQALHIPPITYTNHTKQIHTIAQNLNATIQALISTHTKATQERLQSPLLESLRTGLDELAKVLAQENIRVQGVLVSAFESYKSAQITALEQQAAHNLATLESAKTQSPDALPTILSAQKTIHSLHNEVQIILKALR